METKQVIGIILLVCMLSLFIVGCAEKTETPVKQETGNLTEPTDVEDVPPAAGRIVVKEKSATR